MTRLRWTGGHFTDGSRGFRTTGDSVHEFEDDERVQEYLEHRSGNWERVEDDGDETSDAEDVQAAAEDEAKAELDQFADELEEQLADEAKPLPFNPEDHTNAEIVERVEEIDDVPTLRALRNIENEQKGRSGATDAIEDRIDELEG